MNGCAKKDYTGRGPTVYERLSGRYKQHSWCGAYTMHEAKHILVHALLGRVPSPIFGLSMACLFHWTVVTLIGRLWRLWTPVMLKRVVGRSEWSAKRERSEREADHERRQM